MTSQYPAKIDDNITLPVSLDNSTLVRANVLNELRGAIIAIESAMGVNPASVYGTVKERLDTIETALSNITIGSGGIVIGGDLSGSSISQTVVGLQGNSVSSISPSDGYVLTWKDSSNSWTPLSVPVGLSANELPAKYELSLSSGLLSTTSSTFTRAGGRQIDMTAFSDTIGALTRSVVFLADIDMTNTATSVEVRLYDITHSTAITGTDLTSSSTTNTMVTSGSLTVGSSAGNIRSDVASQYELQFKMNGGGVSDAVFITNSRLVITYA